MSEKSDTRRSWHTFLCALAWAAISWIAFPPVGFWPLGWLAVAPLAMLVWRSRLQGRRPYFWLWAAGLIYWLATFYFIPIPHPALWGGWFVVSAYLAVYTPLFVVSARTLVHRMGVPVVVAVPVCWVGWEYVRCIAFTGMGMVCLSHTQYTQPRMIQVADLSGAYTLTFALALFATCIVLVYLTLNRQRWTYVAVAVAVLAGVTGYGYFRLSEPVIVNEDGPKLNVALIQSSIDTAFPKTQEEYDAIEEQRYEQLLSLTHEARTKWPELDLVVWPESAFPMRDALPDVDLKKYEPEDAEFLEHGPIQYWSNATGFPQEFNTQVPLLTGVTSFGEKTLYNSAVLIDGNGVNENRYFKNHLVMFGEYVPGRNLFPWVQELTPIGRGLTVGDGPKFIEVKGMYIAPNICFESTVPHLIRDHYRQLSDDGRKPDVLLNVTNDGWFYGTSCLDFHLACNVFRAVEVRTPMLVCANTGLSAEIDSSGRLLQTGPRRKTGMIRAHVEQIDRASPYLWIGDVLPALLAVVSVAAALFGMFSRSANPLDNRDAESESESKVERS